MKLKVLFLLVLILIVLSGCWDQMLYEEIGFILQVGLEVDEQDELLYSVTVPVVSQEVEEKVEVLQIMGKNLLRKSKEELRSVTGKKLMAGKVQNVYFSKEIAQRGINEYLEIFIRDPDNPMQANLIIVDGSPLELEEMGIAYKNKPRLAFYVTDLLKDARDISITVDSRLYHFSILQSTKTIDPVLPFVRYDQNAVEIAGSAVFDEDKMVGELNTEQTILLNLLMGRKKSGRYSVSESVPGDKSENILQGMAIMIKGAKRKIAMNIREEAVPEVNIHLQLKMTLEEYTGEFRMDREDERKKVEEHIALSMEAECRKLLQYLQEVGSDPIGFEEIIRSKYNALWKKMDWKEKYQEMVFHVEVDINMESYGAKK